MLISVKAVGLNFRDVLNVLGLYPGDPGDPGGDCAGTIAAVGSAAATHHRFVPVYDHPPIVKGGSYRSLCTVVGILG